MGEEVSQVFWSFKVIPLNMIYRSGPWREVNKCTWRKAVSGNKSDSISQSTFISQGYATATNNPPNHNVLKLQRFSSYSCSLSYSFQS